MAMTARTPTTSIPEPPTWALGQLLRAERERQGLTRLDVTIAIRQKEDSIRFCETGPWPAWKALQPYIDFLGLNAPKSWMTRAERALDRAMTERLGTLSPAGRVAVKALMLKACRDSSVGRAVV